LDKRSFSAIRFVAQNLEFLKDDSTGSPAVIDVRSDENYPFWVSSVKSPLTDAFGQVFHEKEFDCMA
jgi:hypothetical protein